MVNQARIAASYPIRPSASTGRCNMSVKKGCVIAASPMRELAGLGRSPQWVLKFSTKKLSFLTQRPLGKNRETFFPISCSGTFFLYSLCYLIYDCRKRESARELEGECFCGFFFLFFFLLCSSPCFPAVCYAVCFSFPLQNLNGLLSRQIADGERKSNSFVYLQK